ncbi:MAG: RNase adapter RapZ, partial [Curvibacter sp.]
MEIVLITGMSGSGKSVALNALEDAGYYWVDNLPPELLQALVTLEQQHAAKRVAIAMDVRSATSLPMVPAQLTALRQQGITVKPLFLDASTETLI